MLKTAQPQALKMNLQFFAGEEDSFDLPDDIFSDGELSGEEDVILPGDYQEQEEVPEEVDPVTDEESLEDTTPTEDDQEPSTEPQTIKVKYNSEEKEIPLDEAVALVQKGMNYDKIQERLEALQNDPRLSFVEEMARDNNMTTEQFLQAVREQKEQDRLNELIQQNIPEEYAREILESRKFREQYQAKEKQQQEEQKRQAEFQEFLDAYPDVKAEDIPKEVWEKQKSGIPLKYAYMEHEKENLMNQLKVLKQNQKNAERAPVGSVTAHGGDDPDPEDDFLKGFNSI